VLSIVFTMEKENPALMFTENKVGRCFVVFD